MYNLQISINCVRDVSSEFAAVSGIVIIIDNISDRILFRRHRAKVEIMQHMLECAT